MNLELWAILQGLELARLRGFAKLVVESDCSVAIDMLKDNSEGTPLNIIVRKIKEISRHLTAVEFQFVRRRGNLVADYLARSCISFEFGIRIINSLSSYVKRLILNNSTVTADE